jgi:hypothetical protein
LQKGKKPVDFWVDGKKMAAENTWKKVSGGGGRVRGEKSQWKKGPGGRGRSMEKIQLLGHEKKISFFSGENDFQTTRHFILFFIWYCREPNHVNNFQPNALFKERVQVFGAFF